jgi:hypothetical protein
VIDVGARAAHATIHIDSFKPSHMHPFDWPAFGHHSNAMAATLTHLVEGLTYLKSTDFPHMAANFRDPAEARTNC